MPSLEELIRQFAERARRQLMEEVERSKNQDTSIAKWEGYDSDGNPIVKDGDQTKIVKGIGNTGMVKGTRLILDDAGSAEYKRRTKQEQKKVAKKKRKVVRPTRLVTRDNLISVIAAFEEEIHYLTEEQLPIFEIPANGFYVCTYSTLRPEEEHFFINPLATDRTAGLTDYSVSSTSYVTNYTNQATGGTTWRITAGAVAASSLSAGGKDGTASASVSGLGINVSVATSGDQEIADVAIEIAQTNVGGEIEFELDGSNLSFTINILGGKADADAESLYVSFPRAIWYYQILNDPEDETLTRIRQIDLNSVVPNQVYESKLVHNFAVREGSESFVYSIWYVIDVDMTQTKVVADLDNGYERLKQIYIGKKTYYIVHARLNVNTGEIVTKATVSPNTGSFSILDGSAIEYPDDVGSNGLWLINARAYAYAEFFAIGQRAGVGIDPVIFSNIEHDLNRGFFNPEAVWRESFEGDCINVYSDVAWDSPSSASISDPELANFLLSSYKEDNFYRGWDSLMPTDLVTPEFIEWDPTGDPYEGNARPNGVYQDMENLQARITILGTPIQYANYFDGSQANAPDDYDQWRIWSGVNQYGSVEERLGPNFATPENVNETGLPRGDRLRRHVWFSYVPPSA